MTDSVDAGVPASVNTVGGVTTPSNETIGSATSFVFGAIVACHGSSTVAAVVAVSLASASAVGVMFDCEMVGPVDWLAPSLLPSDTDGAGGGDETFDFACRPQKVRSWKLSRSSLKDSLFTSFDVGPLVSPSSLSSCSDRSGRFTDLVKSTVIVVIEGESGTPSPSLTGTFTVDGPIPFVACLASSVLSTSSRRPPHRRNVRLDQILVFHTVLTEQSL